MSDRELLQFIPILEKLAAVKADVRNYLIKIVDQENHVLKFDYARQVLNIVQYLNPEEDNESNLISPKRKHSNVTS